MLRPLVLAALLLTPAGAATAAKVSPTALVAAAKAARLTAIDPSRADCADGRSVAEWLKAAIAPTARSFTWHGGRCVLTNPDNPIDAGGHWCAHADLLPKKGRKRATIEIYFEEPAGGRPGPAYAFRAFTDLRDGDSDYSRDTVSFEYNWRQAHEPKFDDQTKICAPAE